MAGTWALEESASASGREDVAEELASEHGALSDSDAEDLIAMGPATMDSEIPRPPTLSGCGWWQDPLWRSLEAWRRKRPHSATRSMRHVAVCAGALTERYGFKAMGMDTVTVAACDTKEVCFQWARRNHEVKHWFNSLEDMLEPYAKCGQCNKQCSTTLGSVDVVIGGLPCQPYSRKRSKRKVGVTQHPAYRVGFDLFFSFLDKHDIAGFIIEEVIGFNDVEATTGQRPLECFVALARQRNFAVQVLVLNAEDWAQVPRQRFYVIGIGAALGGTAAVKWISERVDEVMNYRHVAGPTPVWDIVSFDRDTCTQNAQKPAGRKRSDIEWRKQSAKLRDELGLSVEYAGWSAHHTLQGLPKTDRVTDFVDIAWAHRRQSAGVNTLAKEASSGFWCDPSQAVERKAWGGSPGTLCATTLGYSFEKDTTLSGFDHCKLQGFPTDQCPHKQAGDDTRNGFTDDELRDISGNSFFVPDITAVAYTFWLNPWAPWWAAAGGPVGEIAGVPSTGSGRDDTT